MLRFQEVMCSTELVMKYFIFILRTVKYTQAEIWICCYRFMFCLLWASGCVLRTARISAFRVWERLVRFQILTAASMKISAV
jgi:hypothetical protein